MRPAMRDFIASNPVSVDVFTERAGGVRGEVHPNLIAIDVPDTMVVIIDIDGLATVSLCSDICRSKRALTFPHNSGFASIATTL